MKPDIEFHWMSFTKIWNFRWCNAASAKKSFNLGTLVFWLLYDEQESRVCYCPLAARPKFYVWSLCNVEDIKKHQNVPAHVQIVPGEQQHSVSNHLLQKLILKPLTYSHVQMRSLIISAFCLISSTRDDSVSLKTSLVSFKAPSEGSCLRYIPLCGLFFNYFNCFNILGFMVSVCPN